MTKRQETSRKTDQKVFKRTATKTKIINLIPTPMRGGMRM